jgi:hypothetical protein
MARSTKAAREQPTTEVKDAKRVMDDVVVLDVTFHRPGISKQADLSRVSTDSDKDMLNLTKNIVDAKEYSTVVRFADDVRMWLAKRSLPSPLKRGTYLVPVGSVEQVCQFLDQAEERYKAKAEEFLAVYPEKVAEARIKLGDQFNADNYLPVEQLRASFWIERRLIDFGLPSEEKIGRALWEKEKQRAEETWSRAVETIQEALRTSFQTLVGHLAERLEPKPDGTRKVLRDTAIDNMLEFIDLFKARNVTGDAELEGLIIQASNVLKGKKPEDIRKSDTVRGEIAGEMARVQKALDKLMDVAPRRRISFDD